MTVPPVEASHATYQFLQFLESQRENSESPPTSGPANVQEKHDKILRVAEFLFGSLHLSASLALADSYQTIFTKVTSPHRSLWLVKGSSSDLSYMCFVPPESPGLFYCTCRSFLEKTTKQPHNRKHLPQVCKHLLALQMLPHLGLQCPELSLSDHDFAALVLDRTLGSQNITG